VGEKKGVEDLYLIKEEFMKRFWGKKEGIAR